MVGRGARNSGSCFRCGALEFWYSRVSQPTALFKGACDAVFRVTVWRCNGVGADKKRESMEIGKFTNKRHKYREGKLEPLQILRTNCGFIFYFLRI